MNFSDQSRARTLYISGQEPDEIAAAINVPEAEVREFLGVIAASVESVPEPPKPKPQVDPRVLGERMRIRNVPRVIDGPRRSAEHPDIQAYLDRTGAKIVVR